MTNAFLQTKLYIPPLRPSLVRRPRLISKLDEGLDRKLTLVSAPAGFGKTTLITEWITNRDPSVRAAWLSLDEADSDPVRFWGYVVAALQIVDEGLGQIAAGQIKAAQAGNSRLATESVLILLINDLAAYSGRNSGRIVLVLDDYHLVGDQAVHQAMAFLLSHSPPNLHLVIATRVDPPLQLPRLRADAQLGELREKDLRFSPAETAEFLNALMALNLSAETIAALESRTEGWVASLQLVALALQDHPADQQEAFISSFEGSHAYIVDYLMAEVLQRQTPEVQEFLLQTAILDRLTGPLCDAVTGRGDSGAMLEYLRGDNLFLTALDDERRWFRYHRLFADVLHWQLENNRPDEEVVNLHRLAACWYEKNGQPAEAMGHAIAGKDFVLAAGIAEEEGGELLATGGWGRLLTWLDALPVGLIHQLPDLTLFAAWASLLAGRFGEIPAHLAAVEDRLETATVGDGQKVLPEETLAGYRGQIAAIRGWLAKTATRLPACSFSL